MSTKTTIAYLPNELHYYHDFADDALHLRIQDAQFECRWNGASSSIDVVLPQRVASFLGIAPKPRDWNNIPPHVIESACLSIRHDYGLMPEAQRNIF